MGISSSVMNDVVTFMKPRSLLIYLTFDGAVLLVLNPLENDRQTDRVQRKLRL